jgi:FkbM family methyltransferase
LLVTETRGGGGEINAIRWGGHAIYYRRRTSDPHVIHSILLKKGRKAEYWIPKPIQPRTILDIGGNIGAVAVFFAHQYPEARIYTFEPIPSNFEILARNISPYPNIRGFNVALGAEDGNIDLIESPGKNNFGGFSLYQRGANETCRKFTVGCRSISGMLDGLGVEAPDLIKIDTEGAESMILRAISPKVLSRVQWIVGELHGEGDFELLAYLSKWLL